MSDATRLEPGGLAIKVNAASLNTDSARIGALQAWNQANGCPIRLGIDLAAILSAVDAVDPIRAVLVRVRELANRVIRCNDKAIPTYLVAAAVQVGATPGDEDNTR